MRKLILTVVLVFIFSSSAHALVIINEIFADPAAGLAGDANNDGVRSASDDEFVELLNDGESSVDISGWLMKDALQTRHVFSSNTILLPYEYIVIFGGGNPNLPSVKWQKASTGALNLNNTNETVSLFNNSSSLINQVSYTTLANNDQSMVRFPETASSNFVLHSVAAQNTTDLFSPGTSVSGEHFSKVVTPELPTYFYFLSAWISAIFFKILNNPIKGREVYA